MLIFPKAKLTFLAAPKTGTTAIEASLSPRSGLVFRQNPYKHIDFSEYRHLVVPLLALNPEFDAASYETVCIIREPMDYLKSWYRYQSRQRNASTERSTSGISFADYITAVLSEKPPTFAQVRRLSHFVSDGTDRITTILRYGDPGIESYFSHRIGAPVTFPRRNVSPPREIDPLPSELEAQLREAWAEEFRFYDEIPALDMPPVSQPPLAIRWKKRAGRVYRALKED